MSDIEAPKYLAVEQHGLPARLSFRVFDRPFPFKFTFSDDWSEIRLAPGWDHVNRIYDPRPKGELPRMKRGLARFRGGPITTDDHGRDNFEHVRSEISGS